MSDGDIATQQPIQSLLDKLRLDAVSKAQAKLEDLMSDPALIEGSQTISVLDEIARSVAKNTHLDALHALDELSRRHVWTYQLYTTTALQEAGKGFGVFSTHSELAGASNTLMVHGDNQLKVFDTTNWEVIFSVTYADRPVLSPDGKYISCIIKDYPPGRRYLSYYRKVYI